MKPDIRKLSLEEIKDYLINNGQKAFRAKQIYEWLWKKNVHNFSLMTNISKDLIKFLEENFSIQHLKIDTIQKSHDGTIKTAFSLEDNKLVEGVLIPTDSRATACVSCQVGCKVGCEFCATAKLGLYRNLTAGEIYDQVFEIKRQAEENNLPFSNIVFMGMGEPLMNYININKAIELITSDNGLGMSPTRLTLSTAGIPILIKKLADDGVKYNLAVSLHSAIDSVRSSIMKINDEYNLEELGESIKYFYSKTKTRVTFEYLLLDNINDGIKDAKALAEFCKAFPCKINIIEYNPTGDDRFRKSTTKKTDDFVSFLEKRNMIVHVRRSRGKDIDAACGQLANKKKK